MSAKPILFLHQNLRFSASNPLLHMSGPSRKERNKPAPTLPEVSPPDIQQTFSAEILETIKNDSKIIASFVFLNACVRDRYRSYCQRSAAFALSQVLEIDGTIWQRSPGLQTKLNDLLGRLLADNHMYPQSPYRVTHFEDIVRAQPSIVALMGRYLEQYEIREPSNAKKNLIEIAMGACVQSAGAEFERAFWPILARECVEIVHGDQASNLSLLLFPGLHNLLIRKWCEGVTDHEDMFCRSGDTFRVIDISRALLRLSDDQFAQMWSSFRASEVTNVETCKAAIYFLSEEQGVTPAGREQAEFLKKLKQKLG